MLGWILKSLKGLNSLFWIDGLTCEPKRFAGSQELDKVQGQNPANKRINLSFLFCWSPHNPVVLFNYFILCIINCQVKWKMFLDTV